MAIFIARALGACLCLLVCASAQAGSDLTLAEALRLTLERNPELRSAGFTLTAAKARVEQAGQRPATALALDLENFAGNGDHRGSDALESTLSLSRVIEIGDKRRWRLSLADADMALAQTELRGRQLDLLAQVTRRFIDVATAQRKLEVARENSRLAQESLEAITRRVAVARSPVAEQSRARIAVVRARIHLADLESTLRGASHALAATLGDAEPRFDSVRADLFDLAELPPASALIAGLERNPEIARALGEARLREAEWRLAQAQSHADLAVSLGVRRFEDTGDVALVAGVSLPLGSGRRGASLVAEADAHRSRSAAERDAAELNARATLLAVYHEMSAARVRALSLHAKALPLARDALAQTAAGHERGRFSFLELASARQEMLDIELAAIDAAADYHRLRAELERLTGEPAP